MAMAAPCTPSCGSAPLQCAHCHPSPNTHQATTQTDVLWTGLASAGSVTPTPAAGAITGGPTGWTTAPTCTNYCHGATLGGGAHKERHALRADAPQIEDRRARKTGLVH